MSAGTVGLVLGVVALVLGGSALGIALSGSGHAGATGAAGPAGATGPQGSAGSNGANGVNGVNGTNGAPGAAGPGAVVAQVTSLGTTDLTPNCTYYKGANVSINAPGPGEMVVTATITVAMFHTTGYGINFFASLWNTTGRCAPSGPSFVQGGLVGALPTGPYYQNLGLVQAFSVKAAGTYTVAVIGTATYTAGSTDTAAFFWGGVTAVFYPA
ncbi:MAG TPA: hypothetical protein VGX00_08395 [Thermoplasmata archaeon]|nr:hypothetical protein [Thermoplasmata archaeon]